MKRILDGRRDDDDGEDDGNDEKENDDDDEKKKPEVDDEEKLESGGEVGKGGVDRVSHLSWVCGNFSQPELGVWDFFFNRMNTTSVSLLRWKLGAWEFFST